MHRLQLINVHIFNFSKDCADIYVSNYLNDSHPDRLIQVYNPLTFIEVKILLYYCSYYRCNKIQGLLWSLFYYTLFAVSHC